jgi:hypothetical protein
MDPFMALGTAVSFVQKPWHSEDEYYRHHDKYDIGSIRNWPIATTAAFVVVLFVASGVFS